MRRTTNLSDNWRVNKSGLEHIELVNALKAVRKVVGHLNLDINVLWTGMSLGRKNYGIELPPDLVLGEYPIPGDKMDVLVGYAVHEALHIIEKSSIIRAYFQQKYSHINDSELVSAIIEAGEDVHIEGIARKKGVLGKYSPKFRTWWNKNMTPEIPRSFPSLQLLIDRYLGIVLDLTFVNTSMCALDRLDELFETKLTEKKLVNERVNDKKLAEIFCEGDRALMMGFRMILTDIAQGCEEPLRILLANTKNIISCNHTRRISLYEDFWSDWGDEFIKWKKEAEEYKKELKFEEILSLRKSSLSSGLAESLEQVLAQDTMDIDAMLDNTLDSIGRGALKWAVLPTKISKATELCKTPADPKLVQRLKAIFHLQKQETRRLNRGLKSGKIDASRLYRVSTTETIFKNKYFEPESSWNIAILVDASSSMALNWYLVESMYATISGVWSGSTNKFYMYAYGEDMGTCDIIELYHGGRLFTITPSGSTPSSQAIMAMASIMPKGKRTFILHITDGGFNVGVDIDIAVKHCKNENIDLVTIGPEGMEINELRDRFGSDSFVIVDSIEELPDALGSVLKKKLLGS